MGPGTRLGPSGHWGQCLRMQKPLGRVRQRPGLPYAPLSAFFRPLERAHSACLPSRLGQCAEQPPSPERWWRREDRSRCFDFEQTPWACAAAGVRGPASDPGAPPLLLSLLGKLCLGQPPSFRTLSVLWSSPWSSQLCTGLLSSTGEAWVRTETPHRCPWHPP